MQPMTIRGFINTLWEELKLWWDGLMNSVCETLRAKCPHPTSPPPSADKKTNPPFRLISNLRLLIPAPASRASSSEEAVFSPFFSADGIFPEQICALKKRSPLRCSEASHPHIRFFKRPRQLVVTPATRRLLSFMRVGGFSNFSQTRRVQKWMSNILFHITHCLSFSFQSQYSLDVFISLFIFLFKAFEYPEAA